MANGFGWGQGATGGWGANLGQSTGGWGMNTSQPSTGFGGFGQTQTGFGGFSQAPAQIAPIYQSASGFGMNPYASYLSTPGYGALGGYGPTGALSGQDLSAMAYEYGKDPQALAATMQRSGITGADMQEAGVLSPSQYTQMFRPSNKYQGETNPNQYYQPIYQSQYQNYASPAYASLANANNMGTYNQLAQNTAPRTSFGTAYLMGQQNPAVDTGGATVFGSQKLSSDQIMQQAGDYTKNTAQQNYDLMGKLGLTSKDVARLLNTTEANINDYLTKGGVNRAGVAYDPSKTYDPVTGTTKGSEATEAAKKIPEWYTKKDYKYGNYENFGDTELSGFTKDQLNNLYASKQTAINKDIAQAKLDYAAALKSGNPAFVREAQANLDARNNQLAQYNADYKASLGALTGAKGTYETKAMTADRLDTTALGKLDTAAKKYTSFTAPTLKAGSTAAQITKAYNKVIGTQQTEMNNAKKALDAAIGPKAKEAAQRYYDAQKADYDNAVKSLDYLLHPENSPEAIAAKKAEEAQKLKAAQDYRYGTPTTEQLAPGYAATREAAYQKSLADAANAWRYDAGSGSYLNSITGEQQYDAPAGFATGGLMSLLRR